MTQKMIKCKTCQAEIASSAKACPSCGAKNKKPIFKQWWFWVLVVIIIGSIGAGNKGETTTASGIAYESSSSTEATATEKAPEKNPEPPAPKKEKFEIVGEITEESDQFAYYLYGVIKNNSGKDISYAQITFNLYDSEGNQIGTALDNINNLEKDGKWKFKAMALGDDIASYKLAEITGF